MYLSKDDLKKTKVISALKALAEVDFDIRDRVAAEAIATESYEAFLSSRGLKPSRSHDILRLSGKRSKWDERSRPPGDDHGMMFNKNGKPFCYVSQPYQLSQDTVAEMLAFAAKHDLSFYISSGITCWHFPGSVISIVWTYKNEKRFV